MPNKLFVSNHTPFTIIFLSPINSLNTLSMPLKSLVHASINKMHMKKRQEIERTFYCASIYSYCMKITTENSQTHNITLY